MPNKTFIVRPYWTIDFWTTNKPHNFASILLKGVLNSDNELELLPEEIDLLIEDLKLAQTEMLKEKTK